MGEEKKSSVRFAAVVGGTGAGAVADGLPAIVGAAAGLLFGMSR